MVKGAINRLKRHRIDPDKGFKEGGWFKEVKSGLAKETHYEYWKGSKTGGKKAFPDKMLHIGGQLSDISVDPLKYIKQHDPQNSSGAVKEALDIMMKLKEATKTSDLMSSIRPLQEILGGDLYGSMKKASAASKVQEVIEEEPIPIDEIIAALIKRAIEIVSDQDPDKGLEAAALLNSSEIQKIKEAYVNFTSYQSTVEITEFVNAVNSLIPVFRAAEGNP